MSPFFFLYSSKLSDRLFVGLGAMNELLFELKELLEKLLADEAVGIPMSTSKSILISKLWAENKSLSCPGDSGLSVVTGVDFYSDSTLETLVTDCNVVTVFFGFI